MKQYVAEVLMELLNREIWKQEDGTKDLWKGFVMCALKVSTPAYPTLLRLPIEQLKSAMEIARGPNASKLVFFAKQNQQGLNLSPEVMEVMESYTKTNEYGHTAKKHRKSIAE
jgi:hypothetical protein